MNWRVWRTLFKTKLTRSVHLKGHYSDQTKIDVSLTPLIKLVGLKIPNSPILGHKMDPKVQFLVLLYAKMHQFSYNYVRKMRQFPFDTFF